MRKLLIDERIRGFAKRYAAELQYQCPNVKEDLKELRDSILTHNTWLDDSAPKGYIDSLIADYPSLLIQEPQDWDFNKYDKYLKKDPEMLVREVVYGFKKDEINDDGTLLKKGEPLKDKLYERILFCLRYTKARSILGPIHQDMGLKACFYCNIMPTDSSSDGKVFYEMDHLKAKSLYPFLGTCFYNLQPCDGACNKRKNAKPCDSQLYVNDVNEERSPFSFVPQVVELNKTRLEYQCLEIGFVDNKGVYSDACKQYDETFEIISHYSAHLHDVEKVYWRYARCGVMGLREHYSRSLGYVPTADEIYEFCLGFPFDEERIHEEPLRKLKCDTVKQLIKNGVLIV